MSAQILTLTFAAVFLAIADVPALAQNSQSWVSATGSGSACTRTAPCLSFATAQDATAAGGVISILDAGSFLGGNVNITKALTVRAEGLDGGANIAEAASGGFWFHINAGVNDVVTLEGLHLAGAGVVFNSARHLHVVRCTITNQPKAGGVAIRFQPNNAAKLSVTDTVISNFGLNVGGGIVVSPQAGGSALVNLARVTVNGNVFGIAADGTGSTAGINMTIADSMVGGNSQDGIVATTPAGGAPIGVMVTNTKSVNNTFGIRSLGPNVTVRVESSKVTGNGTGLSFGSGGALLTFGNNAVQANGVNGAFSGSVGLQ